MNDTYAEKKLNQEKGAKIFLFYFANYIGEQRKLKENDKPNNIMDLTKKNICDMLVQKEEISALVTSSLSILSCP